MGMTKKQEEKFRVKEAEVIIIMNKQHMFIDIDYSIYTAHIMSDKYPKLNLALRVKGNKNLIEEFCNSGWKIN